MAGIFWCVIGLVALVAGAELLVRQGTKLAVLAGIPPILVGLTIVALGTSTPELAVGIEAALLGKGSLAVGNIAGTNTVNILLILGLSAWLLPMPIERRTLQYDLPAMTLSSAALVVMAADGIITRSEGAILLAGAVAYTGVIVVSIRREKLRVQAEFARELGVPSRSEVDRAGIVSSILLLAFAIAIVVKGADWLVLGASGIARDMGVSDALIGLTIVAIGTSSPELVTTVVSTIRNKRDIALGNLIGSSAYNILAIFGLTALVPADGIIVERDLILIDIPLSGLAALACIPIFFSSRRVTRREGASFVAAYLLYLLYLVFQRS